jgi:ABC-type Mn2+/Zn2+ transport system permease subunit
MSTILEPLDYEFFVRGLIAATMVGGLCGLIGVYIVLRRMSYIGHGLSHAVFGGAVVSYVMSFNFYIGASLWGFVSALLINTTSRRRPTIGADAAIGIITTASFALGIALISRYRTFTRSFDAALFGNILGVTDNDLIAIGAVAGTTLLIVFFSYKQLLFTTFDPDVARYHGIPVGWIDTLFSLILAGVIVVSMQVLGVTLIAATIVTPPIIARLLTNSFHRMVIISTLVGLCSGFVGIYISYFIDVSSGATIVLLSSFLFVVTLCFTSVRDWFTSRAPRLAPAKGQVAREAHLFE